jgi:hypothetical protein
MEEKMSKSTRVSRELNDDIPSHLVLGDSLCCNSRLHDIQHEERVTQPHCYHHSQHFELRTKITGFWKPAFLVPCTVFTLRLRREMVLRGARGLCYGAPRLLRLAPCLACLEDESRWAG